ncbi:hypothetical protein QVD17_03668 [Tagetes erecta]|uniref:Uncharacterized protein n=1 Tax=Tagetes erecta TaxID=13708 RepID=A0AAD8P8W1_TARER|nr:hypothetical protein QVD17_03668 [Tagetes erecta]
MGMRVKNVVLIWFREQDFFFVVYGCGCSLFYVAFCCTSYLKSGIYIGFKRSVKSGLYLNDMTFTLTLSK